jgi:hypothetical protein
MCSVISTSLTLDRQEKRLIERKFEEPTGLETGTPSGPNASDFTAIKASKTPLKSTVLNENLGTPTSQECESSKIHPYELVFGL